MLCVLGTMGERGKVLNLFFNGFPNGLSCCMFLIHKLFYRAKYRESIDPGTYYWNRTNLSFFAETIFAFESCCVYLMMISMMGKVLYKFDYPK